MTPRAVMLLLALVLALVQPPAHAGTPDHRRWTPTPDQPTAEGYTIPVRRHVTYSVIARGAVTTSVEVFRRQAQETFDDPRGWRYGGVEFRRVRRGGDFTLVL